MTTERLAELSRRQLECLRLVAGGYEAKEIGRRLGISDLTVKNHLRAARSALGVGRSIDAARLVVAWERTKGVGASGPGPSGTSTTSGIVDRSYLDDEPPGRSGRTAETSGVRDAGHRPIDPAPPGLPLPFPTRRGQRNELGLGARLALAVVLTVLLIAAVGFFVQASRGLDL